MVGGKKKLTEIKVNVSMALIILLIVGHLKIPTLSSQHWNHLHWYSGMSIEFSKG